MALYFIAPAALKNTALIIASLIFYTWGEPHFVATLLTLCAADFVLALVIERGSQRVSRLALGLSLAINVASLGYFKYTNFFLGEVNRINLMLGFDTFHWEKVILPIGISFFTFHKISYVVDVYRRIRPAAKNPVNFLLYILFFPQLISGPIVRYHEIEEQLHRRKVGLDDLFEGAVRFAIGLAKKVLIADVVGHTADSMFALSPAALDPTRAWIGLTAYTAQIYFDFSGYSDMAIGIARMFGFRFPENFNQPYLARSFTDFWRRWHMSFGRWMREYLYQPLGGNKHGAARTYLNLWIVFLFSGLWHGAQWTFILWGVWHGFFMTLERLFLGKILERTALAVQVLLTLFLVMLSRVLFRAKDLRHAAYYAEGLLGLGDVRRFAPLGTLSSAYELTMIVVAYAICLWPLVPGLERAVARRWENLSDWGRTAFRGAAAVVLLFLSVVAMAGTDFSPFIYFQF